MDFDWCYLILHWFVGVIKLAIRWHCIWYRQEKIEFFCFDVLGIFEFLYWNDDALGADGFLHFLRGAIGQKKVIIYTKLVFISGCYELSKSILCSLSCYLHEPSQEKPIWLKLLSRYILVHCFSPGTSVSVFKVLTHW